jgi:hypothetical protein
MSSFRGVSMRRKQRGVTAIGWIFLLGPLAVVGYAGIRLAPVYLNYIKVARALEQTATSFKDDPSVNAQQIRSAIERRFDIESINFPTLKEVVVRRQGQRWVIQTAYEDVAPLFANVSLLVTFDRTVEVR